MLIIKEVGCQLFKVYTVAITSCVLLRVKIINLNQKQVIHRVFIKKNITVQCFAQIADQEDSPLQLIIF